MLELYPEGFEEVEKRSGLELVAYTDAAGEERMWHVFGMGDATDVEEGWEDRWRTFHRPLRVGGLWIGPPWETAPDDAIVVVVDPGRAFGTGAHPTTQLCLELIQELEPGSFLDVGCGSGVLGIAAALLGHGPVLAIDIEAPSITAALENAGRNGVELEARVVKGDERLPLVDSAVANISIDAVRSLPTRVDARMLVTSGYFLSEQPVLDGYTHVTRRTYDGWAADLYTRK